MKPVEITDANFSQEVLKSDTPVLIDFWAEWCAPCKMIAPVVEELAKEYQGKLKVGKVDVDANQTVAGQYGIRSIPTLLCSRVDESSTRSSAPSRRKSWRKRCPSTSVDVCYSLMRG